VMVTARSGWRWVAMAAVLLLAAQGAWGGAVVPRSVQGALAALQTAAQRGDRGTFERLVADPVTIEMWAGGRTRSSAKPAREVAALFTQADTKIPNPFRAKSHLVEMVASCKRAAPGAYKLRVAYLWPLQITTAGFHNVSKLDTWQVCDLELRTIGARLLLKRINLLPEDYQKNVVDKWLAYVARDKPKTDAEALAQFNQLVHVLTALPVAPRAKQPAQVNRVVEEPAPPPRLLPPRLVTPRIRQQRSQADTTVRRQFPTMARKLLVEAIERFRGRDFFTRVYQQKTVFRTFGRDFRLTKRLIFSFDPQGRMLTFIAPQLEPKDPTRPPSQPLAEQPVRLAAAPKAQRARCMVLTNLAKVARRHPQNARSIEQYLRTYGEIIDIGAARINADDWRAVDRLVEQRFNPKTHDCLFIFGGPEVVPHAVYTNPIKRKDEPDKVIYSDDYYGDFTHDDAQDWEVMVVRLPDDRGILQEPNSIVNRSIPSDGRLEYSNFAVYGNCAWPVSNDMARMGNPARPALLMSKPYTYQTFKPSFFRNSNLFINLHGSDTEGRMFWGEEPNTPKVTAVGALGIDQAVAPGSVVFASSCYGASIAGKTSDNSIALRFLRNGARCYIGCTRVSYISTDMNRTCGLWAKLLKAYLDKGECPPRAFMLAKRDYARSGIQEPHQFKIYHAYIYLGVPPHSYKGDTSPPPPPPPAIKSFEVRWHRLFEAPEGNSALLQEHARQARLIESGTMKLPTSYTFPRSTTRRIFCLVLLRNLLHGQRDHAHQSVTRFYGPTGKLVGETKDRFTIGKDNSHFLHMGAWGNAHPGTWAPGRHRVLMQLDGTTVADAHFTIVADATRTLTARKPPGVVTIRGLGVNVQTFTKQRAAQRRSKAAVGAFIHSIHPRSPAAKAGMQVNDCIVFVGSAMVRSAEQVQQHIDRVRPGTTIKIVVTKPDGFGRTHHVTLGRPITPPRPNGRR